MTLRQERLSYTLSSFAVAALALVSFLNPIPGVLASLFGLFTIYRCADGRKETEVARMFSFVVCLFSLSALAFAVSVYTNRMWFGV